MNSDTVKLLKSCNVGCKYANSGMEQVLPYVKNLRMKNAIELCNEKHYEIVSICSMLLRENGKNEKEPAPLKLATARIKTDVKLTFSPTTRTVASIMVNGCGVGTNAICKALKNFSKADGESVEIAKSIIKTQQEFMKEMIEYY